MKKKKYIKITIFTFVILLILLITCIIIYNVLKGKNEPIYEENLEAQQEVDEEYLENQMIIPGEYNFLIRLYEGNVNENVFYSAIYKLVFEEIPEINANLKNKSIEEIENYYQNNKERIYSNLGIDNFEDYNEIVKEVSKLENITYKSSKFDTRSFAQNSETGYSSLNLEINFETSSISLKMFIINEIQDNKPKIKFAKDI